MSASVAELPRWKCHKEVWAVKIGELQYDGRRDDFLLVPAERGFASFHVSSAYVDKHRPFAGGYYVVYTDGYQSFSPAEAFEEGYTRV